MAIRNLKRLSAVVLLCVLGGCAQQSKPTTSGMSVNGLGGANYVVVPDSKGPGSDDTLGVTMMHGLWWSVHGNDPDPVPAPECSGSGNDVDQALQMRSSRGTGRIEDVMPCIRLLIPGSRWTGLTAFVIAGGKYYSRVSVKDAAETEHEIYADVTGWAKAFIAEMHG